MNVTRPGKRNLRSDITMGGGSGGVGAERRFVHGVGGFWVPNTKASRLAFQTGVSTFELAKQPAANLGIFRIIKTRLMWS